VTHQCNRLPPKVRQSHLPDSPDQADAEIVEGYSSSAKAIGNNFVVDGQWRAKARASRATVPQASDTDPHPVKGLERPSRARSQAGRSSCRAQRRQRSGRTCIGSRRGAGASHRLGRDPDDSLAGGRSRPKRRDKCRQSSIAPKAILSATPGCRRDQRAGSLPGRVRPQALGAYAFIWHLQLRIWLGAAAWARCGQGSP
jgi:hypothetical protein